MNVRNWLERLVYGGDGWACAYCHRVQDKSHATDVRWNHEPVCDACVPLVHALQASVYPDDTFPYVK